MILMGILIATVSLGVMAEGDFLFPGEAQKIGGQRHTYQQYPGSFGHAPGDGYAPGHGHDLGDGHAPGHGHAPGDGNGFLGHQYPHDSFRRPFGGDASASSGASSASSGDSSASSAASSSASGASGGPFSSSSAAAAAAAASAGGVSASASASAASSASGSPYRQYPPFYPGGNYFLRSGSNEDTKDTKE